MANIESYYNPGGGASTVTQHPDISGAGNQNFLNNLLYQRLAQPPRMPRGRNIQYYYASPEEQRAQMRREQMENLALQQARRENEEQAAIQARKYAGPPKHVIGGPGIIPGYTPDVNAMDYYQRQLYLPQGSGFEQGGTSPMDILRANRQSAFDVNFQRAGEKMRNPYAQAQEQAFLGMGGQ